MVNIKDIIDEDFSYWKKILGEKTLNEVCDLYSKKKVEDQKAKAASEKIQKLYNDFKKLKTRKKFMYLSYLSFSNFLFVFLEIGVNYGVPILKARISEEKIREILINNLYTEIHKNSLRVLIYEMYELKKEGCLQGEDSSEKYEYFNNVYLSNTNYVKKICGRYPELLRIILIHIEETVHYIDKIITNIIKDSKKIEKIVEKKNVNMIEDIKLGLSDNHSGQTVAKITLGEKKIIFKPHSLKKDIMYQDLFNYFCIKLGLESQSIISIDCGDCGFQEYVENMTCTNNKQIENYYVRIGIIIFLCLILSASDMHAENVMAYGEFPILLDLEMLPGIRQVISANDISSILQSSLDQSILTSGLLPLLVWGNGNNHICLSALNSRTKQILPFKSPVIVNNNTSDMHIEYKQLNIDTSNSLPSLDDTIMPADLFEKFIIFGFQKAYDIYKSNKSIINNSVEKFYRLRSRYLIRHTQQYSMYISASLHPDFLKDVNKRNLMFQILRKDNNDNINRNILANYEISSLLDMKIPLFEYRGKGKDLLDTNSNKYKRYFVRSAYEYFVRYKKNITNEEINRQTTLIKLSLALISDKEILYDLKKINMNNTLNWSVDLGNSIKYIADWLIEYSLKKLEINQFGWYNIHHYNATSWKIEPMGMYLYDGLAGICLFFAYVLKCFNLSKYRSVYNAIIQMLFNYTTLISSKEISPQSNNTGLLIGEGSILYTYILLHKITGDGELIHYAELHADIVAGYLHMDSKKDLLSGNAGAIIGIMELYKINKNKKYLKIAEKVAEDLWKDVSIDSNGYGWIIEGESVPLAGLSHGNAGFIVAYAKLLEITHKKIYKDVIIKLLAYENKLYDKKINNWKDLRNSKSAVGYNNQVSNFWCHGAPGIMISRLALKKIKEFQNSSIIERDLRRCQMELLNNDCYHSICICHGWSGNLGITRYYLRLVETEDIIREKYKIMREKLLHIVKQESEIMPKERYSPALMTGFTGVGVVLAQILLDEAKE